MSELVRADELITRFRLRLGHPTEGTFKKTYYDGINSNVDEMLLILNESQRHVTWVCYSANRPLLEDTFYIEVVSGVTRYTLPELWLAEIAVFHRTYGQEYEVERANLFEIRSMTRSMQTDYRYRFYQVREQVPIIAARGVITEDSLNRIEATGIKAARVGDRVYNLTDDSQGIVEGTFPALNALTIEGLSGGKVNKFQKGDLFQIDMKEQTRDAMDFYPAVVREDSSVVFDGNPMNWMLKEDNVVFRVGANVTEIPTDFEEDERVVLNIVDSNDIVVAEGAKEGLVTGMNIFHFPEFFQLSEDVDYSIRVQRADNDNIVPIDKVNVIARENPESIEVRHAKLPRPMKTREDYCEMPTWSLPAVYAYGHIIAQKKMSRNPNADRGLVAEFENEIRNIMDFKYKQDSRGPHGMTVLSGSRVGGWPYPSNFGTAGPSPFDIF